MNSLDQPSYCASYTLTSHTSFFLMEKNDTLNGEGVDLRRGRIGGWGLVRLNVNIDPTVRRSNGWLHEQLCFVIAFGNILVTPEDMRMAAVSFRVSTVIYLFARDDFSARKTSLRSFAFDIYRCSRLDRQ